MWGEQETMEGGNVMYVMMIVDGLNKDRWLLPPLHHAAGQSESFLFLLNRIRFVRDFRGSTAVSLE